MKSVKNNQLPEAFIFMKVGDHAGETWDEILERKQNELKNTGKSFWGYGGNACHPLQQVQPFVKTQIHNGVVQLLMEPIKSNADPDILPAKYFSADGINWEPMPESINVTGSKYALVLEELKPVESEISLEQYSVGVGPSRGRNALDYLRGRTDKACLVFNPDSHPQHEYNEKVKFRKVGFSAKLADPYAVLLKYKE